MTTALVVALAYLLGSIPFSFLVARRFGVADVRKVGSGNVGATNVMRSAGPAAGILALVLDVAKGAAASLIAREVAPTNDVLPPVAAAAAVVGHMYPVWLRFRGGKGVATGAGAFLPIAAVATGVGMIVFVVAAAASRYASLGSVLGAIGLAAATFVLKSEVPVRITACLVAALVVWKHRSNLGRIFSGTENRLGASGP